MAKIKCKLCGKEFSNLGVHLNKTHSITREDYDLRFSPDTELTNEIPDELMHEDTTETIESTQIDLDSLEDPETQKDIVETSTQDDAKIDATTLQENRFDGQIKRDPDRPLSQFLDEFELTEKELRSIVRQFKGGPTMDINQSIKMRQKRGDKQAKTIADEYKRDNLTQHAEIDSWVAEALVKQEGFTCIEIISTPVKKWILKL